MKLYGIKKICDLPGCQGVFWERRYDNDLIITDDLATATQLAHDLKDRPSEPKYTYEVHEVPLSELPDHWLLVLIVDELRDLKQTSQVWATK